MTKKPLSEQFRLKGLEWADADNAATLMEETKTTKLAAYTQALINREGPMPHAHAERQVKATPEWNKEIVDMVNMRGQANRLKIELEYIRMRYWEYGSSEANKRAEMRL